MKELKAIYLPDLAFSQKEYSTMFAYDPESGNFEMESNNDFSYPKESVLEDDSFIIFLTELIEESFDGETIKYGKVEMITKEQAKEYMLGGKL